MVLWKKESSSKSACYVDLLSGTEHHQLHYQFMKMLHVIPNKSADKSTELRMRGNREFKAENWREAMDLYNQSLRHSPNGTENISLAYANRSLCFLQMKNYHASLADIELARKANYPKRSRSKLAEREATCLKAIKENPTKLNEKIEPKLSFEADEKYPDLANVLEIRRSDDKSGNHVVAKCDIDIGQIVMVEEMFVSNIHSKNKSYCKTCLKSEKNFIPCPNCCDVMFCDEQCMMASNKLHEPTCSFLHGQRFEVVRNVESILLAVTAFPNVGSFIGFVGRALATSDLDSPNCSSNEQNKYRSFLKLSITSDQMNEDMKQIVWQSYQLLLEIPDIKQRFQSKREKRFLQHLILQHSFVFVSNGTLFHFDDYETGEKYYEVSGISFFVSFLNHACIPNASFQRYGEKIFVFALRPIKKGEELFITNGKKKTDNKCKCSKCTWQWKVADLNGMKSDKIYRDLMEHGEINLGDPDNLATVKVFLVKLITKYAPLPWTPEFDAILALYDHCIRAEYFV